MLSSLGSLSIFSMRNESFQQKSLFYDRSRITNTSLMQFYKNTFPVQFTLTIILEHRTDST